MGNGLPPRGVLDAELQIRLGDRLARELLRRIVRNQFLVAGRRHIDPTIRTHRRKLRVVDPCKQVLRCLLGRVDLDEEAGVALVPGIRFRDGIQFAVGMECETSCPPEASGYLTDAAVGLTDPDATRLQRHAIGAHLAVGTEVDPAVTGDGHPLGRARGLDLERVHHGLDVAGGTVPFEDRAGFQDGVHVAVRIRRQLPRTGQSGANHLLAAGGRSLDDPPRSDVGVLGVEDVPLLIGRDAVEPRAVGDDCRQGAVGHIEPLDTLVAKLGEVNVAGSRNRRPEAVGRFGEHVQTVWRPHHCLIKT